MAFSINVNGKRNEVQGKLNDNITRLTSTNPGISEEEKALLSDTVGKVVEMITTDYPDDAEVGVYAYGNVDNMTVNATVQVHAARISPPTYSKTSKSEEK